MTADATISASQVPAGEHTLVLYDGVCGLCNRSIQFLLVRDRRDEFRFASLQSELGKRTVRRFGFNPDDLDTMYAVFGFGGRDERIARRSRAVLGAAARLGGIWSVLHVLRIVPPFLLDLVYRGVSRVRYRVFGRYDTCPLPEPSVRHKFLD